MIAITDGAKMLVPLYHATSDLFLPSILEHGLGGKNPHDKLGTYDFARDVLAAAKPLTAAHPELEFELDVFGMMVNQRVTRGGFNFRHGGTYLTPSRFTALNYAWSNRSLGSELLSSAVHVFEFLERSTPAAAEDLRSRYPAIAEAARGKYAPMLVEARNVPLAHLRSETTTDDVATVIDIMEAFGSIGPDFDSDAGWQQCNFELTLPVPPEQLTCCRILWEDEDDAASPHRLERIWSPDVRARTDVSRRCMGCERSAT